MDLLLEDWVAKQYVNTCKGTQYKEELGEDDWLFVSRDHKDCNVNVNHGSPSTPSSFELISDQEIYNLHYKDQDYIKTYHFIEKKRCSELPYIDEDPSLWLPDDHPVGPVFGSASTYTPNEEPMTPREPADRDFYWSKDHEMETLADEYLRNVNRELTLQEEIERKFLPFEFWDSVPARNHGRKKSGPFARERLKQMKKKGTLKWKNKLKRHHYS